jgi:cytochrome c peroxidase
MRAHEGLGMSLGIVVAMAACSSGDDGMPPQLGQVGAHTQSAHCDETQDSSDALGEIQTYSTSSFDTGSTNGFSSNLGTNGRTCSTCHVESEGWTIAAAGVQARASNDPIFAPNDGSDCPPTSASQGPNGAVSTLLRGYGVIRVQIGIPSTADFSLVSATNPKACAIAPGSADANGELFLFRRPLPATNLVFDTTIMFDGRETLHPITSTAALLFDLSDQANGATTGHAQGASIAGTQAQSDIVAFETSLFTAQSHIVTAKGNTIVLTTKGANGGAKYIANVLAPAFHVGINDPLGGGEFTNADFTLFRAWEPTSPGYAKLSAAQQAIGRGEALFNNTTFTIHDVPGLNSVPTNPLYDPNDPVKHDIVGGCAVCHNNPNIGNHSTPLAVNIGVTMAQPTNNDGSPNAVLDVSSLPVYTLRNGATNATVAVTDPGRALVTGKWTDIGKTKGPVLRGLASRAPYFHNGSAKDLTAVVRFYDERFDIGLTDAQISDMVAFLSAL